jgi:flagellar biosynthesis protein FliP
MTLYVIGYTWCTYFQDTCTMLENSKVPFQKRFVQNRLELKSYVRELLKDRDVEGVYGATSPQILRDDGSKFVCIGGHDELCDLCVENVLVWEPLTF